MNTDVDSCEHIDNIEVHAPHTKGCEECLKIGGEWVHLRLCLECGQVGCCDNSPNQHASKHAKETEHNVIQTFEPEPKWLYCYDHDLLVDEPNVFYDGDRKTFDDNKNS